MAHRLKHKAALSVAYGCGLRVSKFTHLKIGDIDGTRMLLRVEQGISRCATVAASPIKRW
jgi:integrase/recombinase XerD